MSFVRPLKGIKTNTQKQKTEHNKKQKTNPDKWYLKNQTNNNKKNGTQTHTLSYRTTGRYLILSSSSVHL